MTIPLYLDVDGVINADMPSGWGKPLNATIQDWEGWRVKLRWAPKMIAALALLDLELRWCTTWRDEAPRLLAPLLGWGHEYERVMQPITGELYWPSIDWKFDTVKATEAPDAKFVWIDDEMKDIHREAFPNALVITTNPRLGITPAHIAQIEEYVAACAEAVA